MEKSYENPAMMWVLDGCRRLTLSDTGVVDKIAHNKSGGDVLHRTAKKGDGSQRCASIAPERVVVLLHVHVAVSIYKRKLFCSHPLPLRPS